MILAHIEGLCQPFQAQRSGQILVDGQEVEITGVESAKEHGIRIIHQELMLIPDMTISENIFIGQEPKTKAGTVDKKKMNEMAQGFLDSMHLDLKSTQFIRDLNIAQQQMVEIIRAISFGAKIIVMDEPTSSLTENEVDALFEAIKALKAKNVGIIYISHRMAELDAITDRITVMRDGEYIDTVVTNMMIWWRSWLEENLEICIRNMKTIQMILFSR